MTIPLAWRNITHNKMRAATSLTAVCVTIILIFMQLGFYDACIHSSVMVSDQLDFDLALVSTNYMALKISGTIPRPRLQQARAASGVAWVAPLYLAQGSWRNPDTKVPREILVLGVDPRKPTFRIHPLNDKVAKLRRLDTAVTDTVVKGDYGSLMPGTTTEVENQRIEVVDSYAHGCGFTSNAEIIVSDLTFARIFEGFPRENVSIGLVKLEPGQDIENVVRALESRLPPDVQVWTRSRLEAQSIFYVMQIKPLGIMFRSGVALALVVGAVIVYQLLATEIMRHLKQYATLRAIGYDNAYIIRVILTEAILFAVCGFVPAALLSWGLYALTRTQTKVPMAMTFGRLFQVLILAVVMCSLAGLLASRKARRANPADLFGSC